MKNNYYIILSKIEELKKYCDYFIYGKSFLGQNLIAFHKGDYGGKQILITGGIHAREFATSLLVCKLCEKYIDDCGVYFLPMLNPDGVKLCLCGSNEICDEDLKKFLNRINKSEDFLLWKANARGVDLNVNFDAGYAKSKFISFLPSPSGYVGENANSEIENKYLLEFIKDKNIACSISYHTKGEVIYYGFSKLNKKQLAKAKHFAKFASENIGYKIERSKNSSGGLSDYLSYVKNIPSITIELFSDKMAHPINTNFVKDVEKKQLLFLTKLVNKVMYGRFT